ncbi:hypothetical protein [Comamonas endophytica]|uniref:Cytochrome oxidase Cu insertion factor (SCO1/SenC/PrrC family) n=1 Tax=Comamonas endophytica TaxID=2949090 RepID=A0ABY6G6Q4_9BURK|nr:MULTISPECIES: hypothetical protein [unclassified Acidovorax]MCD2511322.1 hypothetical protein [Acidovorax sp. D4N7]UYG50716.1 hypothetical protein M9799_11495 [Acidovorax sp. 5MLIR]
MSGSKSSDASIPLTSPPEHAEPLDLSVHGLPAAGAALGAEQRTRTGRWQMLAVLLVCAAPVIASYFTYYVVRPEGRRNFGELIQPQRPLPEMAARTLGGETVALTSLKGQWLLVSVAGGQCNAACEEHLYLQRQLREGLGREKERLDWVWLVDDAAEIPAALAPATAQARVLRVDAQALASWLQPAEGQRVEDHLYLVDPMGNWMLRMPAALDRSNAAKAKRDLDRLLRASSSWDQPGRPALQP